MEASAIVHPAFVVGTIDRRLFGSFVEHLGRCVYEGIYEPRHPTASSEGFRQDVLELVRELGVSIVRYPGGNFVSGYRWEDGVGPVDERPTRLDPAWRTIESNRFGLDEFMAWTRAAGVEPMMTVNLGTRGVEAALDLHEYANFDRGTTLSEQRRRNGSDTPHGIKMWCLGNEVDGPWQLGHKTAVEYGRLARETAAALRQVDKDLVLVACGSSSSIMPTFGAWEAEVLEQTMDEVDFISLHQYYWEDGDPASFIASGAHLERFILDVIATVDSVAAKRHSDKRVMLSVDEWNIWAPTAPEDEPNDWKQHPRQLENEYTVLDAVTVGGLLIAMLKHADRVRTACLAQLVNVIAPIRCEPGGPAWRQTTFYPFATTAHWAVGEVLQVSLRSPTTSTTKHGLVPTVDAAITYDHASGALAVFVINRSLEESTELAIDLSAFVDITLEESTVMTDPDLHAVNTVHEQDRVTPGSLRATLREGSLLLDLPRASWGAVRMTASSGVGGR